MGPTAMGKIGETRDGSEQLEGDPFFFTQKPHSHLANPPTHFTQNSFCFSFSPSSILPNSTPETIV
jgi:hypothetical protein